MDFTNPSLTFLLVIVFVLFVLSIKQIAKIAKNAMWIGVGAVLFPIALNKIFNVPINTDAETIIFFLTIGLGGYALYILGKSIYSFLGIMEKSFKFATSPVKDLIKSGKEKKEKKMKDFVKNQYEKSEKGSKKREKKKKEDDDEDDFVEVEDKD